MGCEYLFFSNFKILNEALDLRYELKYIIIFLPDITEIASSSILPQFVPVRQLGRPIMRTA